MASASTSHTSQTYTSQVTIHGVSNLEEGLRAKVIAFDPAAALYVVKDAAGKVWGLRAEKLRPMKVLELSEVGDEWTHVPVDATLPGGVEVKINLETGIRLARRLHRDT
jgi:hypothetical protein